MEPLEPSSLGSFRSPQGYSEDPGVVPETGVDLPPYPCRPSFLPVCPVCVCPRLSQFRPGYNFGRRGESRVVYYPGSPTWARPVWLESEPGRGVGAT